VQAGLTLGYQVADGAFNRDSYNRVILFTDGVANAGDTSSDGILASVQDYAGKNITLTALGVGMGEFNDSLLEKLADKGNGNYAYINNLDEAKRLFIEKLAGTLDVIAMNAKVQIDFNPEVVRDYRQMGYEDRAIADQNFRNDSVDAGEIGAGHSVTALYQVHLRPGVQGRIATVQLRWEDTQSHEVKEINGNYNTWDLTGSFEAASPRYKLDVAAAYFGGLLRGSSWANSASWETLRSISLQVANQLSEDKDVAEFADLVSQAEGFIAP
jgi:Ca-activated chloride channel family protein